MKASYMGAIVTLKNRNNDKDWEEMHVAVAEALAHLEKCDKVAYATMLHCIEKVVYKVTTEQAEQVVRSMKPYGQKWSMSQIKEVVKDKNVTSDCLWKWYVVMNMKYNDNYHTAQKFGHLDDVDFYLSLTCDYINDEDADPLMLEKWVTHKLNM